MNRRVTLLDVASRAGVSAATASAVLSGKAGERIRVSSVKRDEILAAAKALGYVPNTAAQHLKSGDDNHIIAVFTYENIFPADPRSEYYPFFAGIQQEAEREGYDILILNNWAQDKSRSSRIRLASGAIMIGVNRDDEHITSLVKQEFPLVFVGRRKIGNGLPVHCVRFGYESAVRAVVDRIAPYADRSLVYVSSTLSTAEPTEDKSTFLHRVCSEKGIAVSDVSVADSATPESIAAVLSSRAVIFDRLFIADIFTPIFQKEGMAIGRDVFGAILEDDWTGTHPGWTAWENRRMELGALAVKNLIAFLSGRDADTEEVVLPIVERASTGVLAE